MGGLKLLIYYFLSTLKGTSSPHLKFSKRVRIIIAWLHAGGYITGYQFLLPMWRSAPHLRGEFGVSIYEASIAGTDISVPSMVALCQPAHTAVGFDGWGHKRDCGSSPGDRFRLNCRNAGGVRPLCRHRAGDHCRVFRVVVSPHLRSRHCHISCHILESQHSGRPILQSVY